MSRSDPPPLPSTADTELSAHSDSALLENVFVFGHHGFVQTVPTPPCTWTSRPAAVVLVSANSNPLELELKTGPALAGRVIAVASMVERRLLNQSQPLVSFNVQPLHASFSAFRALNPPGAVALDPEPFLPLGADLVDAYQGVAGVSHVEHLFDELVRLALMQFPPIGTPDSRLASVLEHLHAHPRASVAELGQVVGRSADWVSRTFSSDMGLTLRDYLGWLKQRALLNTLFTKRSITEVALDAGFVSASQFASAYQRWYGRTPSASRDPAKVRIFVSALPAGQAASPTFAAGIRSDGSPPAAAAIDGGESP